MTRSTIYLNVGLVIGDGPESNTEEHTAATLARHGLEIVNNRVLVSDSEPTLVVEALAEPGTAAQDVYSAAEALRQQAIACWSPQMRLAENIGPRSDLWGPFDPVKFWTLAGCRLSEELRRAA